ncbi:MAG: hypothetical protein GEU79_02075 [Acidimicrobiia bacterium]|nr:hypothetical protein [Acidimicrobiia bacterium]
MEAVISGWVDDPESDVVAAEWFEGRWAVRMTQGVRDATTVWWWLGERTVRAEAGVLPLGDSTRRLHIAMRRNDDTWRVRWCLDSDGWLVLRSRSSVENLTELEMDFVLGEIYDQIERTWHLLLRS